MRRKRARPVARKLKLVFCAALAVVVLVLLARFLVTCQQSDVGWEQVQAQWYSSITNPLGTHEIHPLFENPTVQADFWKSRIARLKRQDATDKQLAGAALVIAWPDGTFQSRYLRINERFEGLQTRSLLNDSPHFPMVELDWDAVSQELANYNQLVAPDVVELMDRAFELAPSDANIARTRALLTFRDPALGDLTSRRDDWEQVLDECAAADPGNALYDLLAARFLLETSSTRDFDLEARHDLIVVSDPERYAAGLIRLRAAMDRPVLSGGTFGRKETWEFLEQAGIPRRIAVSRVNSLDEILSERVIQMSRRLGSAVNSQRVPDAELAERAIVRLVEQIERGDNGIQTRQWLRHLKRVAISYELRRKVRDDASGPPETVAALKQEWFELGVERSVRSLAQERFIERSSLKTRQPNRLGYGPLLLVMIELLFLVLVFSGLLCRVLGRSTCQNESTLSCKAHVFAWLGASVSVFGLFGLIPSEVIPVSIQCGVAAIVSVALPVSAVISAARWIEFRSGVGRPLLFTLLGVASTVVPVVWWSRPIGTLFRHAFIDWPLWEFAILAGPPAALAIVGCLIVRQEWRRSDARIGGRLMVLAVACGFAFVLAVASDQLIKVGQQTDAQPLIAPGTGFGAGQTGKITPELMRLSLKLPTGSWLWALLQWILFKGEFVTVVMALFVVGAISVVSGVRQGQSGRSLVVGPLREIGRSSTWAAGLMLVAWLAVVSFDIRADDVTYQAWRTYQSLSTAEAQRQLQVEMDAVLADDAEMKKIREETPSWDSVN